MRTAAILAFLLVACPAVSAAQEPPPAPVKPAEKGDRITVRGCLSGGALDATESPEIEAAGLIAAGLTFRLKGDKKLLKALKDEHDRKVVTLKGVLGSDIPREGGQSHTVGRMRITIGGASPDPHSPYAGTRRALPVLEVQSYEGTGTTACRK